MFKLVSVDTLGVGAVFSSPVYDGNNQKLVNGGVEVTEDLIKRLKDRGVRSILVAAKDLAQNHIDPQPSGAAGDGSSEGVVGSCGGCGEFLPLRVVAPGDEARIWECATCGASYAAVVEVVESEMVGKVRPGRLCFDRSMLSDPPAAMLAFVQQMKIDDDPKWVQQRTSVRHALHIPVPVQPMDEDYRFVGEPFLALSSDVSTGGIFLVHTRAVAEPFLAVELSPTEGQKTHLVLEMLRCQPLLRFYEIAGRFGARIVDS